MEINTLKDLDLKHKTVLYRADLNVPMNNGRIEDKTRIERLVPTIKYLIKHKAKIVVLSHFGRPKGEFEREFSLAPLADALGLALGGIDVKFALDCIGDEVKASIKNMEFGDVLLLENLRFHAGETENSDSFIEQLASLGDVYVNDAFSCSHRAHASIVGIAQKLPSAAGFLLQDEIENLEKVLDNSQSPICAVIGGSKVSTKLELLHSLIGKVRLIIIGGAMANTFLKAQGIGIGKSLYEDGLVGAAAEIMKAAKDSGCEIILPSDVVVASEFKEKTRCEVVPVENVAKDKMILDIGPSTIAQIVLKLNNYKTLIWNGPIGAFECRPFDVGTISLARSVAMLTSQGNLTSVAGGGDIVAVLGIAGITDSFSYISTAGGAFLEWLEGKKLPGVAVLSKKVA